MAVESKISSIWITNGEKPSQYLNDYKPDADVYSIDTLYNKIANL